MQQEIGYKGIDCGKVTNGTPVSVPVPLLNGTNKLVIKVLTKYAAVAGTSGVAVTFKYSLDGSSYSASAVKGTTIAPAATVLGSQSYEIGITDLVTKLDPAGILDYEVVLTNTDATNVANYAVLASFL